MYYSIERAEDLRKKYSSWIGKRAHVGGGRTEVLKHISIQSKKVSSSGNEKVLYRVQFEFENKTFNSHQFLKHNSQQFGRQLR